MSGELVARCRAMIGETDAVANAAARPASVWGWTFSPPEVWAMESDDGREVPSSRLLAAEWKDEQGQDVMVHVVANDPATRMALNRALSVVLDGIAATLVEHDATTGQGYRSTDGRYGDIDPACRYCGTFDEYAVEWPCSPYRRATASLAAIADALGVDR